MTCRPLQLIEPVSARWWLQIIDNAVKYSFEGGVVSVSAKKSGDFVEFSVKDNGIGMPPSVVSNLFKKFYRSHRSRDSVGGSGIGLYVCRIFVEAHGGSISVRSKENEGSEFTFTVPIYESVKDKLIQEKRHKYSSGERKSPHN